MKKQSGFTLIELLLVLAIIGIISAIAIPAILSQRDNAKDKSCIANVSNIFGGLVSAADLWSEDNGPILTVNNFVSILGTSAETSKVPEVWRATNPWKPSTSAYDATAGKIAVEDDNTGKAALAAVSNDNLGQVMFGFYPGDASVSAAVMTKKAGIKTGTDKGKFVKVQGLG